MYNHLMVGKQMTDFKLNRLLYSNTWKLFTVCKQMSSGLFKNVIHKLLVYESYSIYIYIYIYIYIGFGIK